MSYLLRHGADKDKVDHSGDSPLIVASRMVRLFAVEVLVKAGANLNIVGAGDHYTVMVLPSSSALGVAAQFGYVGIMEVILGAGAEVNATFRDGCTALHGAALKGEVGVRAYK